MARRFHAEIILPACDNAYSIIPPACLESGHEITARDLHAHVSFWKRAQKDLDQALRPELGSGLRITRVLLRGNPAHEIVKAARDHNVNLIAMSTHKLRSVLTPLLLGSVTAKVLHETDCLVWTGACIWKSRRRGTSRFAAFFVRWN